MKKVMFQAMTVNFYFSGKKIACRLSTSESEFEDSELNRDEWTRPDKLMSLEPFLDSTGVQEIPRISRSIFVCNDDRTKQFVLCMIQTHILMFVKI